MIFTVCERTRRTKQFARLSLFAWLMATPHLIADEATTEQLTEENTRIPTEELIEGIKSSDGRWFEVEMIIFARNNDDANRELFDSPIENFKPQKHWDLFKPILEPNLRRYVSSLDFCWSQLDPLSSGRRDKNEAIFGAYYGSSLYKQITEQRIANQNNLNLVPIEPSNNDGKRYEKDLSLITANEQSQNVSMDLTEAEIPVNQNTFVGLNPEAETGPIENKIERQPVEFSEQYLFDPTLNELDAQQFYHRFLTYQERTTSDWQFTKNLCVLPQEDQPVFWKMLNGTLTKSPQYNNALPNKKMAIRPTGPDLDDFSDVYLIAPDNLKLNEHYKKLEAKSAITPLMHVGWRQPGLSKSRSMPLYIVAGTNYSDAFHYDGSPKYSGQQFASLREQNSELNLLEKQAKNTSTSDIDIDTFDLNRTEKSNVQLFMEKMQNGAVMDFKTNTLKTPKRNRLPDETWQLDGAITVHLNHYLYLDAKFNYREPVLETINTKQFLDKIVPLALDETNKDEVSTSVVISAMQDQQNLMTNNADDSKLDVTVLKHYPLEQVRRSYSGDLHYLDHPKFGILFQIRKYRH